MKCPYCAASAEMVSGDVIYPHRPDLFEKKFWRCEPCDAYVGCHPVGPGHDGTRPLGRLANAELRRAKQAAHAAFDPIWKNREMSRAKAYRWLANRLSVPASECHIGMFDTHQCKAVIEAVNLRN